MKHNIWWYLWRGLRALYFHDNGKFSWTAAMSTYGLYRADQIIRYVQGAIEAGMEVDAVYLQWTVPVITALIAARPVQMGLSAIKKPAGDGAKVDPFEDDNKPAAKFTGDGTPNFDFREFESGDGAAMPDNVRQNVLVLMQQLEIIREACGNRPIIVSSGYRSPEYNAATPRAATDSQHLYGRAADFIVSGMTEAKAHKIIKKLMDKGNIIAGGLAFERGMIHYDIRGSYATWRY
jgi:hypothetical protein